MICIDASIAIKLLFSEEFSPQAEALVIAEAADGQTLYAPPLIGFEVTNVIRQRVRRGILTPDQAPAFVSDFAAIGIVMLPIALSHQRALALANAYNLPAAYDAHYVALAEWLHCPFWTNDRRLVNTVAASLPFVRWIGDYQPDQAPNV